VTSQDERHDLPFVEATSSVAYNSYFPNIYRRDREIKRGSKFTDHLIIFNLCQHSRRSLCASHMDENAAVNPETVP
jgi:hypothetical protein